MLSSQPNNDLSKMSASEQRQRILDTLTGISADHREKDKVREALGHVWAGGIYEGDPTVRKDQIDEAHQLLSQLTVDGPIDGSEKRDKILEWLRCLQGM